MPRNSFSRMVQLLEVILAICIIISRGEHWGAELLTTDTFGPAIFRTGKPAFINFLKTDSENCRDMKHIWDKLGRYYHGSNIVIADVDCGDEEHGKDLCEQRGINIYPTLVYYENNSKVVGDGVEYEHNRSYEILKMFTKFSLRARPEQCNFHTEAGCTADELSMIKSLPNGGVSNLKRHAKIWLRDRKKLDVDHKKQEKALDEKYESLKLQGNDDRTKLTDEHSREAKEMVQQYRADRMKLTRLIKLANHLTMKNGIEFERDKKRRAHKDFMASEQEIKQLESPMYKQMQKMMQPRTFLSDNAGNPEWVQVDGPKPEDFHHLDYSIFHSPYVFDPNKPMKDQKSAKLEDHFLDLEIDKLDKELDEL